MAFQIPGIDPIDLAHQIGYAAGRREALSTMETLLDWAQGTCTRADLVAWMKSEIQRYRADIPPVRVVPNSDMRPDVVLLTDGVRSVVGRM